MTIFRFSLFAVIFFFSSCAAPNYIYLVRHGEKETGKDPALSAKGINRAQALRNLLTDKKIQKIYSTNYKRTLQTAQALSEEKNIQAEIYAPDTMGLFARKILAQNKNILIVGHSNTLLPFLDSSGITHEKKVISDAEYNNLFIIKMRKGKFIKLYEIKYGAPSIIDTSAFRMQ